RAVGQIVQIDVASLAAPVANRRRAGEIPDPRLKTEIALGERTHGADIHHVRRVAIVQLGAGVEPQLGVVSAVENSELAGMRDLVGEAHTTGTEDTALLVEHDVRAERHGLVLFDLLLAKSRIVETEIEVEVLQVALAGLVAYRAI